MNPSRLLPAVLILGLLQVIGCGEEPKPGQSESDVANRVIYNLDSSEFFVGTFGPVNGETIDRFVDEHAAAGVTDLYVNVNAQRVNYNSDVWEAAWTERNADAPKVEWITNTGVLHRAGVDYPKRMLARARERAMAGWISIRMNDAHLPDQPEHPLHSEFWRAHADWHLANSGLDFEVPEVREHYLNLIDEVTTRYDIDGIELDFLRFQHYFRPGRESSGIPLMTQLVEQSRHLTDNAADRLGHEVRLAVRVPTSPHVSRAFGLDAVDWAARGFVDVIIASPFWPSINTDIRVNEWTEVVAGTGVELAVSSEDGISSGAIGRRTATPSEMRGLFASVRQRGADPYFFNLFTNPWQVWSQSDYFAVIRDAASLDSLSVRERRHVVTIEDPWVEGEPRAAALLPAEGTLLKFTVPIGPKPAGDRATFVELVVDQTAEPPSVFVNGERTEYVAERDAVHLIALNIPESLRPPREVFAIPTAALVRGYNEVEIRSTSPIVVRWVEIHIAGR